MMIFKMKILKIIWNITEKKEIKMKIRLIYIKMNNYNKFSINKALARIYLQDTLRSM